MRIKWETCPQQMEDVSPSLCLLLTLSLLLQSESRAVGSVKHPSWGRLRLVLLLSAKGLGLASLIIHAVVFWRSRTSLISVTYPHFHEMMPRDQVATLFPPQDIHLCACRLLQGYRPSLPLKTFSGTEIWICCELFRAHVHL